ncbi:hypothetical protein ACFYR1_49160 [Streptomyces canus]|uniref:hypothetical protein n=1 Tax=Streptomyces canus TaxID=58343 RepID=UPI00367F5D17
MGLGGQARADLGDHGLPPRPPHRPPSRGRAAIADLSFVGLDDSGPDDDPAVITGYKAARNRPLTRGQKRPNKALPIGNGQAFIPDALF